jgi:inhibitor of KinA sporulation pathway (predicted exonuclease)
MESFLSLAESPIGPFGIDGKEFARLKELRPMSMSAALRRLDLPLEGRHHRGIDDARNIARIAQVVLPEITAE